MRFKNNVIASRINLRGYRHDLLERTDDLDVADGSAVSRRSPVRVQNAARGQRNGKTRQAQGMGHCPSDVRLVGDVLDVIHGWLIA